MRRILAASGLAVTFVLAALAGDVVQHPAVALIDSANIAFLGRVLGVAVEEVRYGQLLPECFKPRASLAAVF